MSADRKYAQFRRIQPLRQALQDECDKIPELKRLEDWHRWAIQSKSIQEKLERVKALAERVLLELRQAIRREGGR